MVDLKHAETGSSFGDELRRTRAARGLSIRQLAKLVYYSAGHLSKVETGRKDPTVQLTLRCEEVLRTGGRLMALRKDEAMKSPAQLPRAPAAFVGRTTELRQLVAAVTAVTDDRRPGAARVVEITGPPGIGKSALALRLAHEVVPHFFGGQLYVDMARHAGGRGVGAVHGVLRDFLSALGVQPSAIPPALGDRAALYRTILAHRRVLVLVDNASGPEQVRPLLPSPGEGAVVVTSRRRLDPLELRQDQRVTLAPLSESESAALLRLLVGPERAGEEADALRHVAASCGHLPLALRIAGERVATRSSRSAHELAAELDSPGSLLDVLRSAGLPTVRGVFSRSLEDVDEEAARLFRLLSTHWGGPVSVDAAAALGGVSAARASTLLDALVDAHLLENADGHTYAFTGLLRAFAGERVGELPGVRRTDALRRGLDWFIRTAHSACELVEPTRSSSAALALPSASATRFADRHEALAWCEAQTPYLVAATRAAVEIGDYASSWKVPIAFSGHLYLRRCWSIWIAAHQIAVVGAMQTGDRYGQACVLHNLGMAYLEQRRFDVARSHLHRSLTVRREIGDKIGEAWALTLTGFLCRELLRPDEATAAFRRAIEIFDGHDTPGTGRIALAGLGDVLRENGRYDEALESLTGALEGARAIGDRQGEGYALTCLGRAYQGLGQHGDALACLDQALAVRRDTDDRWREATVLRHRGRLFQEIGELDRARESWKEALAVFDTLDAAQAEEVRYELWGIDLVDKVRRARRGLW